MAVGLVIPKGSQKVGRGQRSLEPRKERVSLKGASRRDASGVHQLFVAVGLTDAARIPPACDLELGGMRFETGGVARSSLYPRLPSVDPFGID